MMAAGAEQHNTRCALLGGEGGSDCILHDICTLYGHQSMHSMLGRDHHYYYTPHSAAIRCDGVTADGNVCIDTGYTEVNLGIMFVYSYRYNIRHFHCCSIHIQSDQSLSVM